MTRSKVAAVYFWGVAGIGVSLWAATVYFQHPWLDANTTQLSETAILLALTLISSVSPLRTGVGSVVTVSMAPLFGAVLLLPPWAVMTVAAVGTLDLRLPGRDIPWVRFLFNRGMWVIAFGVPSFIVTWVDVKSTQLAWYALLPMVVLLIAILNVGTMSISVWLINELDFVTVVRKVVASSAMTYIALPLVGYMIWVIMSRNSFPNQLVVFLLYGPLLVYRSSMQKQNRLDQWLHDSYIMQSRIVDKRDGQTFGHSQRVGELCEKVARILHLSDDQCTTIRTAGILHDLGKIAIPDSILLKPGKLTAEEYEIIKTHPAEGAQILAEHPEQKDVADIVRCHHERWDGKGYPEGLSGEVIPIGARIVNACDAFDTITQARVFRPTVRTPAEAIKELRDLAGSWYDPQVITALEKIVAERWAVNIAAQPVEMPSQTNFRDVLAIKQFRLLWTGQAVSYFGDMMNTTGLAIMLFLVTHSPSLVAIGLIAKAAPTILFGLVAGPLVDRWDRRRTMIAADIVRALLTVTIPFFALNWLPGVFVSVFLISAASTLFVPAKQAILPNLVPANLLVVANSLVSSSEKTMELLGYSIAGVIAATVSWLPLFLVDAATYLFSAVTLLGVADTSRAKSGRALTVIRDVVEGTRFVLYNRRVGSIMGLTTAATIFGGMILPIFVVFAYDALKSGAIGYGLMEAAVGAGAILGALIVPALIRRARVGILILAGVAGIGLMQALTGLTSILAIALVFLLVMGIASTVYYVPMISVIQRESPDYIRGRVMATRFLLVQAGLLTGMGLSGPLTDRLGAPLVFFASGVLIVCIAVLGAIPRQLREATLATQPADLTVRAAAAR